MERGIRFAVEEGATVPRRATDGAAGYDVSASESCQVIPHEIVMVPTGVHVEVPYGYVGLLVARSSLAVKHSLMMANSVGVIDSDYRGQVYVPLINVGDTFQEIVMGTRIAQLMFVPTLMRDVEVVEPDKLTTTERGDGGFGSTGEA